MQKRVVWVVLCMMVTAGLVACGGGGGTSDNGAEADKMTVTVSSPTGVEATTYTEGPYNVNGNLDPNISALVLTNTIISLCSGGTSTMCATQISIMARGNTPQSYPTGTAGTPTQITYNYKYSSVSSSDTGTVTLTSVGNVGEKITGSFSAVVANMSNPTDTRGISGTFSVKRNN